MKTNYTLFALCISALAQCSPIFFTHDELIKSENSTFMKLKNYKPQYINASYTPQQVITVRNEPKKLPVQAHIYSNGMQHLKYIATATEEKTKETDKKMVELLVRAEPLGKQMHQLLSEDKKIKANDTVVRLYRKVDDPINKNISWRPILTAPADSFKDLLQANITIAPDGKLYL
ncbi:MAG: hypothetical protein WD055_00355 [Candidatus Dependentiae bacterium]